MAGRDDPNQGRPAQPEIEFWFSRDPRTLIPEHPYRHQQATSESINFDLSQVIRAVRYYELVGVKEE